MKKKKFRFQLGAFLMFMCYGGLFLLLFWRIVHIQATGEVEGHALAVEAAAKYEKETVLSADRGKIFDRDSNIIAEDTLSYRLVAVVRESATTNPKKPRHVVDPQETAKILAQYIPMEEAEIYSRLTKEGDPYQVEFASAGRGISYEVMTKIEELALPGLLFVSDKKRYYPNGSFASHLIGFALKEDQKDGTPKTVGKMGLESIYNDQLTGEDGSVKYQSDAFRYLLPNSEKMVQPATDGSNIYLTLDKTIQNFLEDAMTRVNDEYKPESMVGVVANPKTGEILAMTQRPTFDPDTRVGLESNWLNDVIENVIEPGSTMKIFTVGAAVDSENWHPNATYKSGRYTLLDRTIRDHNINGWGTISYLEGFQRSSNTGMAHLLEIMGRDTFVEYIDKFGFGHKTGIDLPGEAPGTILTKVPSNILTMSYGQGSTVTPIQLVQALSAIANDGQMMQPYVIDKIVNPNTGEVTLDSESTVKGQPISAETAKTMRELLASTVTSEVGTAQRFKLEGYDVAGKTGTAQMPKKNGVGYRKNEFLHSFLGMAPVEDPQLIMYIAIAKPQLGASEIGSDPVSKVFNSVMQNSLKYLNINPEDVAEVEKTSVSEYVGEQAETVQVELINKGLKPVIIGEGGEVLEQYPKAKTTITEGSLVFLKTDGAVTLPSFGNWSLRNMLVYKTMSNLPIEIVGEGFVENQSVSANTVIVDTSPIVVKLKTPQQFYSKPLEATKEEGEQLPQD